MAIDPQFTAVVGYLKTTESEIADGTLGLDKRPWMNFGNFYPVGQFDYAGLHEIFTRQSTNDEYGKMRQGGESKAKDLQTAKLSADFLAGFERDYRMRRRGRIRMLIHSANRSYVNGEDKGPLEQNTTGWLTRILAEDVKE